MPSHPTDALFRQPDKLIRPDRSTGTFALAGLHLVLRASFDVNVVCHVDRCRTREDCKKSITFLALRNDHLVFVRAFYAHCLTQGHAVYLLLDFCVAKLDLIRPCS